MRERELATKPSVSEIPAYSRSSVESCADLASGSTQASSPLGDTVKEILARPLTC